MSLMISPQRQDLSGKTLVFLAGSIEMGKAEDWQTRLARRLEAVDPGVVVANPRRKAWDSRWVQSIDNPVFREQVEWELDHIERADLVVFYFQPGTQSPITLLELGKHLERAHAARHTLVCCPEGFWRKGNVDIACARKGMMAPATSLDELERQASDWLRQRVGEVV